MSEDGKNSSTTINLKEFVPWSRIRNTPWAADAIIASGLFAAALVVRLPNLMLMPAFTDETVEVLHSLPILHGTPILLTNADPYYGSIFNYMVAAVFYLFGPSAEHARLLVTLLGAATIPLCYFFAKELEDRQTGMVAALMMLTSAALIWNGHIAWENETTPFFATLTFLVLALALKRGSGPLLIVAGFCYGLTLQTHPGLIILGVGLLIYFLYSGVFSLRLQLPRSLRGWAVTPWPYLAVLGAAVGYGNVIAQNIVHPASEFIAAQRHTYAYVPAQTLGGYVVDFQNFWIMLLRMASSSFDGRSTPVEYLLVPINVFYIAVLAAGVGYAFKTWKLMPVILLVTTGIMLPYFNKSYGYPGAARYVGYLFPLLYLLAATPLTRAAQGVGGRLSLAKLYIWLLMAFLVVAPAISLYGFYRSQEATGNTNDRVLAVHDLLRQQYQVGVISEVVIDNRLSGNSLGGGGNVARSEDYLFTLDGVPHRSLNVTPEALKTEMRRASARSVGVIVGTQEYRALSAQVPLSALGPELKDDKGGITYGAYVTQQ